MRIRCGLPVISLVIYDAHALIVVVYLQGPAERTWRRTSVDLKLRRDRVRLRSPAGGFGVGRHDAPHCGPARAH